MRRLIHRSMHRSMLAASACACAAACSIPEKTLVDQGPPFACLGMGPPTIANPQVTISGTVIDSFSMNPLPGVPVDGHLLQPDVTIFMTTTDANGRFRKDQATLGVPRDAFLRATPTGFLETRYYPAGPIARDLDTGIQVLTPMNLATIVGIAGVQVDPSKAIIVVTASDCNGQPVGGATVTTNPRGTTLYIANGSPSTSAVATDGVTGSAFIINVEVSNTMISATVGNMTLRSHSFDTIPGVISQTEIQP